MSHRWFFAAFGIVSLTLGLALSLSWHDAGVATAAVPNADISSAGPLTHVYIGNDLSCQIAHTGDSALELFPPAAIPGDCGTFVVTGGTLYAPDFASHDGTATGSLGTYTPFTPVSQSAVSGAGTVGDPFKVTTVADAGSTGLRITETDTYVAGTETYRTDVTVQNTGQASQSALIYRAGDCYLGGTDVGFGVLNPVTKAIGCTQNANNVPPGRIEVWSPITPADHYFESFFDTVWEKIGAKASLPDTCDCTTSQDNGAAIEWDRTIGAGQSATLSHFTTFSPLGTQPLVASKTADASTAAAGGSDGYTISIENPNADPVTVTSIVDTLPAGFSYTNGSSSGLTTADPAIASQVLTWSGSFLIPGAGTGTLHFMVTVASQPDTYFNSVSATAAIDVVPSGATAPITVTEGPTPTATNSPTATATSPAEASPTATSTSQATDTPTAIASVTATSTATAISCDDTVEPSQTARATHTAGAITRTPQTTRTAQSTRTAHATVTAHATQSAVATPTCETASPTATSTAEGTNTPVPTSTSTVSVTSSPESSTSTPVPTTPSTAVASATRTSASGGASTTSVPSTATHVAGTAAAGTSTAQSSVLAAEGAPAAPGSSVAGAAALPSTGTGTSGGSQMPRHALSLLLVLAGVALIAGAAFRRKAT